MENPEGDYFATTDYVHAYQFDPKTLNVCMYCKKSKEYYYTDCSESQKNQIK